jgi:ABC-type Mn2+/Zn2+ transport system permease subunit
VGLYVSYALDIASGASIVLTETFAFLVALLITSIRKRVRANRAVAQENAR